MGNSASEPGTSGIQATVNIPSNPKGHGSCVETLAGPVIQSLYTENPMSILNMALMSIILTAAQMVQWCPRLQSAKLPSDLRLTTKSIFCVDSYFGIEFTGNLQKR